MGEIPIHSNTYTYSKGPAAKRDNKSTELFMPSPASVVVAMVVSICLMGAVYNHSKMLVLVR